MRPGSAELQRSVLMLQKKDVPYIQGLNLPHQQKGWFLPEQTLGCDTGSCRFSCGIDLWKRNGQSMLKMNYVTGEICVVMTNMYHGVDQTESGVEQL